MIKELKEDVKKINKMMCKQNVNLNKETENQKRNCKEILQLKFTIAGIKIALEGLRHRLEQIEEGIIKSEDRAITMIECEKLLKMTEEKSTEFKLCDMVK